MKTKTIRVITLTVVGALILTVLGVAVVKYREDQERLSEKTTEALRCAELIEQAEQEYDALPEEERHARRFSHNHVRFRLKGDYQRWTRRTCRAHGEKYPELAASAGGPYEWYMNTSGGRALKKHREEQKARSKAFDARRAAEARARQQKEQQTKAMESPVEYFSHLPVVGWTACNAGGCFPASAQQEACAEAVKRSSGATRVSIPQATRAMAAGRC